MKLMVLISLIAISTFTAVHADEKARTGKRFGLMFGVNNSPAPSTLSANLGVNATSFMRLSAGGGFSNSWINNVPRSAYNYTAAPIAYGGSWIGKCVMYGIAWFFDAFGRLITTGKISKHLEWNDFWPGMTYGRYQMKYLPAFNSQAYGGGGQFLIPGAKFSPVLGIHWARVNASKGNPYGITGQTSHVYYSGGVDWQASSGFQLGASYNYCPKLSKSACGIGISFGKFF